MSLILPISKGRHMKVLMFYLLEYAVHSHCTSLACYVNRLASSSSQENFIATIIGKLEPRSRTHIRSGNEALWFYENVFTR